MRVRWSVRRSAVVTVVASTGLAATVLTSTGLAGAALASTERAATAPIRPVPAVPAGSRFVAAPRGALPARGVRQVCAPPTRPGQMACMALARTRASGAVAAHAGPPSGAYSPAALREAYGLWAAAAQTPPSTETVALVDAYSDPSAAADLAVYRGHYGLQACTTASGCLRIVNQTGGSTLPRTDPSGSWAAEESLDLDMVSAICPQCSILLVEAKSDEISDLATAEQYATSHANAVSNSWGSGAEFTGERSFDADFYRPGVAITAAAGDSGYGTQYPAASPFVTAVGGTFLRGASATSPGTQTAWAGTGAGCSVIEPRPSWQTAPAGCLNRTETDVSAEADPYPGVAVYDSFSGDGPGQGWTAYGGTSVATPIIASTYALADIAASIADGRAHAGLVPGTLPATYPYLNGGLTDVLTGSDGRCRPRYLCTAGPGYDGPTGLGTPAGAASFTGPAAGAATVIDPGTQVFMAGAPVRLQILSLLSGSGGTTTFSATGLPAGLAIDPHTGVISGHAPPTPAERAVTVTRSGPGVTAGSASFTIVVLPVMSPARPSAGPVRLALGDKCLADAGRGARPGARVSLGACGKFRHWAYLPGSSPWSAGALRVGGRCLSALGGSGARVTLRTCRVVAAQRWAYRADDHLYNPASGSCLAADGAGTKNGTPVRAEPCRRSATESWLLPAAPITVGIAGRCLADPRAVSGARAEIAACGSGAGLRWTIDPHGDIASRGMCLAVRGASIDPGAAVEVERCGRAAAARWVRGPDGELLNAYSGLCLADPGNAAAVGTALIQQGCYLEPGELWLIS